MAEYRALDISPSSDDHSISFDAVENPHTAATTIPHCVLGLLALAGFLYSTARINCQGQGDIAPCGAPQPWQRVWCNSWSNPEYERKPCVNMCGLVVAGSASPESNKSGVGIVPSLACTNLLVNDTAELHVVQECDHFCRKHFPQLSFSPLCLSHHVAKTCFKASVGVLSVELPEITGIASAVMYWSISWTVAVYLRRKRPLVQHAINWGWAETVSWPFPYNIFKDQGSELQLAQLQLTVTGVSMNSDRVSDVMSLWTYLKHAQPFYACAMIVAIGASGDILQTHGLTELIHSYERGWVPTQGLADAKAREGFIDGAWGVLLPCAIMFSSQLELSDLATLLWATATSLYGVIDGVGASQDLASAMVGNGMMTFSAQRKIPKTQVKILRALELLVLLPFSALMASRGLKTAYIVGVAVLMPTFIVTSLWCYWDMKLLNPKIIHNRFTAVGASLISATCWPLMLLWPGGFYDAIAMCAKRSTIAQLFTVALPPNQFYICRAAHGAVCLLLLLRQDEWLSVCPAWLIQSTAQPTFTSRVWSEQWWIQLLMSTSSTFGIVALIYFLVCEKGIFVLSPTAASDMEHFTLLLQQQEQTFGPEHAHVAITLQNLSNAYGGLGDHRKQKELLERALAINEREFGPEHAEIAPTLTKLGNAYGLLGDDMKQKELLERALVIETREFGPWHANVAFILTNLGMAYSKLGDHRKEKMLLEDALVIKEREFGPEHNNVAITLMQLGNAYGKLGDARKQKELVERALAIKEREFGPEHADVAVILMCLGYAYGKLGDARKHKELFERALAIYERDRGPEHVHVGAVLGGLGDAYGKLGDARKQKQVLERALTIIEREFGPDHFTVANILTSLGDAYGELGDAMKQKELAEKALVIKERKFGAENAKMAGTLTSLGNAYGKLGDARKQKELVERALAINEREFGPEHADVANTLTSLGNAYGKLGDARKHKELLERALAINEREFGPEHADVANTLTELGNAYGELDDARKQKELLERALAIYERERGPEHACVAITLTKLATVYGDLGDARKKKELLGRALAIDERERGNREQIH